MTLEILSVNEMYNDVSNYCSKQTCPKLSENGIGNCGIENFCNNPADAKHDGLNPVSMFPNLACINLERAYEKINRTIKQT